jgi:hypothetical protein
MQQRNGDKRSQRLGGNRTMIELSGRKNGGRFLIEV